MRGERIWQHYRNEGLFAVVRKTLWLLLLFAAIAAAGPGAAPAAAHSVLLEATPAPNATLSASPNEIRLTFNERMEKELYTITVIDERGERVSIPAASMSADQREIYTALPKLPDGLYTVSYHIISADGHPVAESYVITVGKPSGQTEAVELGHKHLETVYGFRMLHYLFFLLLAGWIGWRTWLPLETEEARRRYRQWLRYWRHLNLMFLLETIALETIDSVGDITWANVASLWFHTTIGWMWIASAIVALAAYAVVGRRRSLDFAWVVAAIVTQTLSGHPLAATPMWTAAIPDAIHLAAAALWVGGLGLVAVFFRRVPEAARAFLPRFSQAALYSLVALTVTGAISMLVYVSRLTDLIYTGWGRFLLAKIGLVALVVITGSRLRRHMRQDMGGSIEGSRMDAKVEAAAATVNGSKTVPTPVAPPIARWLRIDLALMVAIVGVVGILTYLSPTPANTPVTWKIENPGITRTLSITPNAPGVVNQFALYVTQEASLPGPKLVELSLVSADRPEVPPIEVELQPVEANTRGTAPGQKLTAFAVEGRYLPYPGKWRVELRVRDVNDDEKVWTRDVRIFAYGV